MVIYDRSVQEFEQRFALAKAYSQSNPTKKCVNFGCGPMIIDGWVNVDKYYDHPGVLKAEIEDYSIFPANSVDLILSSHSLEHVPFHVACRTLHRWYDMLATDGRLLLLVPDLENQMMIMLDKSVDFSLRYGWYMWTIFGYQASPNIPVPKRSLNDAIDPGQIHYCGFTKEFLTKYLSEIGFEFEDLWSYDGYGTPSLYCQVRKK